MRTFQVEAKKQQHFIIYYIKAGVFAQFMELKTAQLNRDGYACDSYTRFVSVT